MRKVRSGNAGDKRSCELWISPATTQWGDMREIDRSMVLMKIFLKSHQYNWNQGSVRTGDTEFFFFSRKRANLNSFRNPQSQKWLLLWELLSQILKGLSHKAGRREQANDFPETLFDTHQTLRKYASTVYSEREVWGFFCRAGEKQGLGGNIYRTAPVEDAG